ncbi:hypothetical protein LTR56_024282 [Elasticomyces elasticus]|nr:hypothetical protein LTR56_024282 [Elasticomyces elasticus]KAK4905901.1 hypothetical protein LTR49_024871 [Elasticomyces elasticus]
MYRMTSTLTSHELTAANCLRMVTILTANVALFRNSQAFLTTIASYVQLDARRSAYWADRPYWARKVPKSGSSFPWYYFEHQYSTQIMTAMEQRKLYSPEVVIEEAARKTFEIWRHGLAVTLQHSQQHSTHHHIEQLERLGNLYIPAKHTGSVKLVPVTRSDRRISVRPSAARGRILSLDGGGVRGLVQLLVLQMLEDKIGLGLPLTRFFDLIVGTSIGGIVAIALGQKQWSIARCQETLMELSQQVFAQPSGFARLATQVTGGWSELLRKGYKWFINGGMYDKETRERVLKEAFGADTMMNSSNERLDVAVTATTDSSTPCEVFTSYNKFDHEGDHPYSWAQLDWFKDPVKLWAAFFAAQKVNEKFFHDGGMLHNNPDYIATCEGGKIWNCNAQENLLISVGCGDMHFIPHGKSAFARIWNAFEHRLCPAEEEKVRFMNDRHGENRTDTFDVGIYSRLGADAECVGRKWQQSGFVLLVKSGGSWVLHPSTERSLRTPFPTEMPLRLALPLRPASALLDLRFCNEDHSASVSGFPTTIGRIRRLVASGTGKRSYRKRKRSISR